MSLQLSRSGFLALSLVVIASLVAVAYGLLRWLGVDPGNYWSWVVGLLVLWWLFVVVTLPWDLHFRTRSLLADAERSIVAGMHVSERDLKYVKLWARLSLALAIGLHLVTALGLGFLQFHGISSLGYLASGAAILLMGLRPAIRGYEYLSQRLTNIGREMRYPRDDIDTLRAEVAKMQAGFDRQQELLDRQNRNSWLNSVEQRFEARTKSIEGLREELSLLRTENDATHGKLAHDLQAAVVQVAEDGRILNSVRELVKFIKGN